ncbi:hypothetical protein DV515_00018970, partial [Chloebia gouldiae]
GIPACVPMSPRSPSVVPIPHLGSPHVSPSSSPPHPLHVPLAPWCPCVLHIPMSPMPPCVPCPHSRACPRCSPGTPVSPMSPCPPCPPVSSPPWDTGDQREQVTTAPFPRTPPRTPPHDPQPPALPPQASPASSTVSPHPHSVFSFLQGPPSPVSPWGQRHGLLAAWGHYGVQPWEHGGDMVVTWDTALGTAMNTGGGTGGTPWGHCGDPIGTPWGHTAGTLWGQDENTEETQWGQGDNWGTPWEHCGDTTRTGGTPWGHHGDRGITMGTSWGHRGDRGTNLGAPWGHRGNTMGTRGTPRGHHGDRTGGTPRGQRGDTVGTPWGQRDHHGGIVGIGGTLWGHRGDTTRTARPHPWRGRSARAAPATAPFPQLRRRRRLRPAWARLGIVQQRPGAAGPGGKQPGRGHGMDGCDGVGLGLGWNGMGIGIGGDVGCRAMDLGCKDAGGETWGWEGSVGWRCGIEDVGSGWGQMGWGGGMGWREMGLVRKKEDGNIWVGKTRYWEWEWDWERVWDCDCDWDLMEGQGWGQVRSRDEKELGSSGGSWGALGFPGGIGGSRRTLGAWGFLEGSGVPGGSRGSRKALGVPGGYGFGGTGICAAGGGRGGRGRDELRGGARAPPQLSGALHMRSTELAYPRAGGGAVRAQGAVGGAGLLRMRSAGGRARGAGPRLKGAAPPGTPRDPPGRPRTPETPSDPAMVCGGFACSRNALCALNVVYVVSGAAVRGMGPPGGPVRGLGTPLGGWEWDPRGGGCEGIGDPSALLELRRAAGPPPSPGLRGAGGSFPVGKFGVPKAGGAPGTPGLGVAGGSGAAPKGGAGEGQGCPKIAAPVRGGLSPGSGELSPGLGDLRGSRWWGCCWWPWRAGRGAWPGAPAPPLLGGAFAVGVFLLLIAGLGLLGALRHHQVLLFFVSFGGEPSAPPAPLRAPSPPGHRVLPCFVPLAQSPPRSPAPPGWPWQCPQHPLGVPGTPLAVSPTCPVCPCQCPKYLLAGTGTPGCVPKSLWMALASLAVSPTPPACPLQCLQDPLAGTGTPGHVPKPLWMSLAVSPSTLFNCPQIPLDGPGTTSSVPNALLNVPKIPVVVPGTPDRAPKTPLDSQPPMAPPAPAPLQTLQRGSNPSREPQKQQRVWVWGGAGGILGGLGVCVSPLTPQYVLILGLVFLCQLGVSCACLALGQEAQVGTGTPQLPGGLREPLPPPPPNPGPLRWVTPPGDPLGHPQICLGPPTPPPGHPWEPHSPSPSPG